MVYRLPKLKSNTIELNFQKKLPTFNIVLVEQRFYRLISLPS